jgi:photosystem II stability/assembly factor-like uncharacterized protein
MRRAWALVLLAGCSTVAPAAPTPTWTRIAAPTTEDLCVITVISEKQGWIAGKLGTVLGTVDDGLSWTLLSGPKLTELKNNFNCSTARCSAPWTAGRAGDASAQRRCSTSTSGGFA